MKPSFWMVTVCLACLAGGLVAAEPSVVSADPAVAAERRAIEALKTGGPLIIKGNDEVIRAAPKAAPGAEKGSPVSLRFEQSPITEVINTVMGEILRANYVIHQPVAGSITLSTNTPVPVDDVVAVLESALQANGVLMVRDARGTYHLGRPEALKGVVPVPKRLGAGALPAGHGTVIIPLRYIGAAEMAEILKPVAGVEAFVKVDPLRNLLVLAGTRNQVDGWLSMVDTFDVNLLKGMSVGVFPLKHISAKDVESAMRLVVNVSGGKPDAGGALPGIGGLHILPIERINSVLIVSARAELIDHAAAWIEKIDRPLVSENEQQLFVYRVQNGAATSLAAVLNGIFGGGANAAAATRQGTGVAPGLNTAIAASKTVGSTSGTNQVATAQTAAAPVVTPVSMGDSVKVVADERNNSLVIYATAAEYKKIETSLRRLDVAQAQVLIEASIVEVTLRGSLSYGLQWFFNNTFDHPGAGWGGTGTLKFSDQSALSAATTGFSYTLTNPAKAIQGVLNALAKDSLIKVISSPSLMVMDNQMASINVGNQQPVQTGTTISSTASFASTAYEYKNTGVSLAVTPSVNAGDVVAMTVNQSVVDLGDKDPVTNQFAFMQRQISTRVAVKSGETIVLGGLIRGNASKSDAGFPLLKDIPLLGALFSSNTKTNEKTELLVMITPRVVRTGSDAADVSLELRERMRGLSRLGGELDVLIPEMSGSERSGIPAVDAKGGASVVQ
ncbi:MAG: type II secretion system secretin GspD [Uliginosibacterium sp.]|nr:type II secretion system secretin GspD [Uliginosibacterium sp.]